MKRLIDGILVLDKPRGLTSRDALNKAWKWLPRGTRIGHSGTLDPMATGVLLACVGRATRLVEFLHELPKTYRADILFGARSTTDDADGDITPAPLPSDPGTEAFTALLTRFTGDILQVPSTISAVKVAGQRAYHLARKGREPELPPRPVRIDRIQLLHLDWPRATIRVDCGKGTYIRAIGTRPRRRPRRRRAPHGPAPHPGRRLRPRPCPNAGAARGVLRPLTAGRRRRRPVPAGRRRRLPGSHRPARRPPADRS